MLETKPLYAVAQYHESTPYLQPYDTMLIDTSVIGHLLYHAWTCDLPLEEYIAQGIKTYSMAPMCYSGTVKSVIWCGDYPPYWRKMRFDGYKGRRAKRDNDMVSLLKEVDRQSNAVRYPHFEADDVIASYVRLHPKERIVILTVDSDLLQLIKRDENDHLKSRVDWLCAKGYDPQFRSLVDGSFETWFMKKLSKVSSKKVGHLPTNQPQSLVDWKVICGDSSDSIPKGEESRWLIDLEAVTGDWIMERLHPSIMQDFEDHRVVIDTENIPQPWEIYSQFNLKTGAYFPTLALWGSKSKKQRNSKPKLRTVTR